jgi:hypothetical protein
LALKKAGITHCIFNHHFLYDTTDRYDHQGSPQVPYLVRGLEHDFLWHRKKSYLTGKISARFYFSLKA